MPAQMPIAVGNLMARERVHDDRERERVHERRADALHDARRDQAGVARRERTGGRGEREDREADEEDLLAAEAVAELAAEQDQRGERQEVGVDRPLEVLRRRLERALDRRQRDVHDRVVEHDHEEREAHGGERPPLVVRSLESVGVHPVSPWIGVRRSTSASKCRGKQRERLLALDRAHEARGLRQAEEQHRDRLDVGVRADAPVGLRDLDRRAHARLPCATIARQAGTDLGLVRERDAPGSAGATTRPPSGRPRARARSAGRPSKRSPSPSAAAGEALAHERVQSSSTAAKSACLDAKCL